MNSESKPLVIGCDHAAVALKDKIKAYLVQSAIEVHDVGPFDTASVDYPDYGRQVAQMVSEGKFSRGILLCGTGIGMSMVANRFPGVRAALCSDMFSALMSRRHNDANILVMGARVIGDALAIEIVKTWLEESFEGGRHQARLEKFDRIPSEDCI
ncbi:MAG: ribose 5-phosphate isomerase B [Deltaproteobacteria bacterium]|nr:ribose 5-phosphate isomerase B [Deltaproteobacteria bacterium]